MSIDRSFFDREVLVVAPELLGGLLTRHTPDGAVTVRLTEVEAYDGRADPASHAFRGRTARNATMFGPPGHLYCYFIYGMHHSLNLVCLGEGVGTGVLLRAGEVVGGAELARARRMARPRKSPLPDAALARGPGSLAQALGVTLEDDGDDVFSPEWSFSPAPRAPEGLRRGPRVGVSGEGGDAEHFPWRFWLAGEPSVSRFVAGRGPKAKEERS